MTRARAAMTVAVLLAAVASPVTARAESGGGLDPGPGDGATLSVGIRIYDPGGGVYDAGDASAPSPIVYEAIPASSDGVGLEHLCNAGGAPADPADPDGVPFGWWYTVVAVDRFTGTEVARELVCVPFPDPAEPRLPPPPPLPTPPSVAEIWDAVGIPPPGVGVSPRAEGVTGLDTWLWSEGPTERSVSVTLEGWTVTGTARATAWSFDPGDGAPPTASSGPGIPGTAGIRHRYEVKGTYPLRVSATWTAEVTLAGPGVAARPTPIGTAVVTSTREYRVVEVRSVLLP